MLLNACWKQHFPHKVASHIGPEHVLPLLNRQELLMEKEQFWSLVQINFGSWVGKNDQLNVWNAIWSKTGTTKLYISETFQDNRIVHNPKNTLYPHLCFFSGCLKWPKQGKYTADCPNNITHHCEYPFMARTTITSLGHWVSKVGCVRY